METKLKIIQPNGEESEVTIDMAPRPTLHDIQAVLARVHGTRKRAGGQELHRHVCRRKRIAD